MLFIYPFYYTLWEPDFLLNINIEKLTKVASEVFFYQSFRDGFFHGDLHPGNIFINQSGKIIAVAFGIMGRLD